MDSRSLLPRLSLLLLTGMLTWIPSVTGMIHVCQVTGDPYFRNFVGQVFSLPCPCAFRMTRLRLFGDTLDTEIDVEVSAGNSQRPRSGHFFVSDVAVNVSLWVGGEFYHSNIFYSGEHLFDEVHGGWRMLQNGDFVGGLVDLKYVPKERRATLTIINRSLNITFRPVNRRNPNNRQRPTPGIYISVDSYDVIFDNSTVFPNTMCSTFNDTQPISQHMVEHGMSGHLHSPGLLAVLLHMSYNIPQGDQDTMCPTVMGKFKLCPEEKQNRAFHNCVVLMNDPDVVSCFERTFKYSFMHIANATDACLDNVCSQNFKDDCEQMNEFCDRCPKMRRYFNMSLIECSMVNLTET